MSWKGIIVWEHFHREGCKNGPEWGCLWSGWNYIEKLAAKHGRRVWLYSILAIDVATGVHLLPSVHQLCLFWAFRYDISLVVSFHYTPFEATLIISISTSSCGNSRRSSRTELVVLPWLRWWILGWNVLVHPRLQFRHRRWASSLSVWTTGSKGVTSFETLFILLSVFT